MPNEGHIFIPISEAIRRQGEWDEYDKTKKVWRRNWVYGDRKRMVGRVLTITNISFRTDKGEVKRWSPFRVSCFAVAHGMAKNFDVVRVMTPGDEKTPGYKAIADMDFSVRKITSTMDDDPAFFPAVEQGIITLEEEAISDQPRRWKLHAESGVFAPE
jgi:hypothetical protein